eukprot:TRINITY_DN39962_c0_g1_i1.p1 TRINITY_DN39962_c0_g1~~TRINITY_DN39962_c0_g1_i1.p1  ORF type:complete len:756 (-),score=117.75 TRINITY_DN39962_c0_g1_i1:63-2330(-)
MSCQKGYPEGGGPGDPFRSLSVTYLIDDFLKDMRVTGKGTTVYDIEPRLRECSQDVICPRDGRLGAAFVDVASDPFIGNATHMLSYSWGYSVVTIVQALSAFCKSRELDVSSTRIWICFACINQHRVKEASAKGEKVSFDEFQEAFGSRVRHIGKVLSLLSPWSEPLYLSRVWCIYELYTAHANNLDVELILPADEERDFAAHFADNGVSGIWASIGAMRVQDARASQEEDRVSILKLVEEGPGFAALNQEVATRVQAWYLAVADQYAKDLMSQDSSMQPEMSGKFARVVSEVIEYQMKMGENASAKAVADQCATFCQAKRCETTLGFGRLMICKGKLQQRSGDLNAASETLNGALDILRAADSETTTAFAECKMTIADVLAARLELDNSIAQYRSAWEVLNAAKAENTPVAATCLASLGAVLRGSGDFGGALLEFRNAMGIYKALGSEATPHAAECVQYIADTLRNLGDFDGALAEYRRASDIFAAMGMERTPGAARSLKGVGSIMAHRNETEIASLELRRAMSIYLTTSVARALEVAECATSIASVLHQVGDNEGELFEYSRALSILQASSLDGSSQGKYIEQKIQELLPTVSTKVRVHSLRSRPELNGSIGTLQSKTLASERHEVVLDSSDHANISIKGDKMLIMALCEFVCVEKNRRLNGCIGRIDSLNVGTDQYVVRRIPDEEGESVLLPARNMIVAAGTLARVDGLSTAEQWNGRWIRVVSIDRLAGRYQVKLLDSDKCLRIKFDNLKF